MITMVLELAAASPAPARQRTAWCAGCTSSGLCCCLSCNGCRWNHGASRSQMPGKQLPPEQTPGGRGRISAFAVRAWWSQGNAALPQHMVRLARCSAHDSRIGSMARSCSRAHLCATSTYRRDRRGKPSTMHACAVANSELLASASTCLDWASVALEAPRSISAPVDSARNVSK